jgi:hypothetical protein
MRTFGYALLCGAVGAIAAKLLGSAGYALVYAGQYRHQMQDVVELLFMALPALLWGLVVGAVCARVMPMAGPLKVAGIGLGATLGSIGLVAAGIAWPNYAEEQRGVPRPALLDGRKVELEFELLLPTEVAYPRDTAAWEFTVQYATDGFPERNPAELEPNPVGERDGRVVVRGRVPLATTTWRRLDVIRPYTDGPDKGRQFVTSMGWRNSGPVTRAELNWSNWDPSLALYDGWSPESKAAALARALNSRYRIRFVSEQ